MCVCGAQWYIAYPIPLCSTAHLNTITTIVFYTKTYTCDSRLTLNLILLPFSKGTLNLPQLPLRVPPDLRDHVGSWSSQRQTPLTRSGRQEEPLRVNPIPQGSSGNPPVIAPGANVINLLML
jgi:hypothetical protein